MNIIFPSTAIVANTAPLNGNTVSTSGLHGIANSSELFMYAAYLIENSLKGDRINFGNTVLPTIEINEVPTAVGTKFFHVSCFVQMKDDYASFPLGQKLWKQVIDRLPSNPASTGFNQI